MYKGPDITVLIPVYNNARTIADVVRRCLGFCRHVIVVDDGSTDGTAAALAGLPVQCITHPVNRGKGAALQSGFAAARAAGFRTVITLDGDGQHFPEDLPAFLTAVQEHPDTLFVGARNLKAENMPGRSTFANRFSNFWFRVQTGIALPDTQTGFRAYPLARLPHVCLRRYEAELALLVFSAWKGIPIRSLPVRVCYPENRVSHFRPFADFTRISLLNTVLCLLALCYGYPRTLLRKVCGH